jgi:hypothetical protein
VSQIEISRTLFHQGQKSKIKLREKSGQPDYVEPIGLGNIFEHRSDII